MKKTLIGLLLAAAVSVGACSGPGAPSAPEPDGVPSSSAPAPGGEPAPEPTEEAPGGESEPLPDIDLPNRPVSSYWYPKDLLGWDPQTDPDAPFNRSSIPLAKRADPPAPSNGTQDPQTRVIALSIMNASTSGNPPQGSAQFDCNTFSYWQYIDTLVYWGGSAGEGLIVSPSPDVTDSAHRNGVPVLGTVFFPQEAHGGKLEWLDDFLIQQDGRYPMAEKLVEVAKSYGFDGWFINQETEGATPEQAKAMREFLEQLRFHAQLRGDAGGPLRIVWYDSMITSGEIDWQNALTDKNSVYLLDGGKPLADGMFLNFWWTDEEYAGQELLKASRAKADDLGISPYQLYAGVDVQANGVQTPIRWELFENPDGGAQTSLGLYCPSWTYFSSEDPAEFEQKESALWVNANGDPSRPDGAQGTQWRGVSTYAIEKTPVTAAPFITHFNLGNGKAFYIDGRQVSARAWNNRSLADIAPTYRWRISNPEGNSMSAGIDYDTAWYGGNSIRFSGTLQKDAPSEALLFAADLPVEQGMTFSVAARSDFSAALDLILTPEGGDPVKVEGARQLGTDWMELDYDISSLAGKRVRAIALSVTAADTSDGQWNLGGLSVTGANGGGTPSIQEVKATDAAFDEENYFAGVRLSWETQGGARLYEVYRTDPDGEKTFLGATPNTCYYVDTLERGAQESTTFEVVPVGTDFSRGEGRTAAMEWPPITKPTADFTVSETVVAPGAAVQFEGRCSLSTQSVEWSFPGADIQASTQNSPQVRYEKEGTYTVRLKAVNASGEAVKEVENLITVTSNAASVTELAQGREAQASGFTGDNEAPPFAFDGKPDTKWCAVGEPPHEITVDLGGAKTVCRVEIAHAQEGGESPDMNTSDYVIETSEDGSAFTQAAEIKRNASGTTSDAFKAVTARYVRLRVVKPTQGADTAARIYEMRVYGLEQ